MVVGALVLALCFTNLFNAAVPGTEGGEGGGRDRAKGEEDETGSDQQAGHTDIQ